MKLDQDHIFPPAYHWVHFESEPYIVVLLGHGRVFREIFHPAQVILHGRIYEHSGGTGAYSVRVLRALQKVHSEKVEDLDLVESNVVLVFERLFEVKFERETHETAGVLGSPFEGGGLGDGKVDFLRTRRKVRVRGLLEKDSWIVGDFKTVGEEVD